MKKYKISLDVWVGVQADYFQKTIDICIAEVGIDNDLQKQITKVLVKEFKDEDFTYKIIDQVEIIEVDKLSDELDDVRRKNPNKITENELLNFINFLNTNKYIPFAEEIK